MLQVSGTVWQCLTVQEGHLGAVLLLQEAVEGNEHDLHGQLIRLHTKRQSQHRALVAQQELRRF